MPAKRQSRFKSLISVLKSNIQLIKEEFTILYRLVFKKYGVFVCDKEFLTLSGEILTPSINTKPVIRKPKQQQVFINELLRETLQEPIYINKLEGRYFKKKINALTPENPDIITSENLVNALHENIFITDNLTKPCVNCIKIFNALSLQACIKDFGTFELDPVCLQDVKPQIKTPGIGVLDISRFKKPGIKEKKLSLQTKISTKKESFLINLPVNHYPKSLHAFTDLEIEGFKTFLAQKFRTRARNVHLISIFANIDVSSIENLSIDKSFRRISYTYKPKRGRTGKKQLSYLLLAEKFRSKEPLKTFLTIEELKSILQKTQEN